MTIAILVGLIIAIALLLTLFVRSSRDAPDLAELARLQTRDEDYQEALRTIADKSAQIQNLQAENARMGAEVEHVKKSAEEKLQLLENAEKRMKADFENLANRIFEEKGQALTSQNSERIGGILQPFKEQLESFRKRVDDLHSEDTSRSAALVEQVRQLKELSNKVSEDANNLAQAIKGDSKKQGDWGEVIVERILEVSGLEEGREYERQKGLREEDGKLMRPDFIVHLPDKKSVIIDSKVSLTAYERFCSSEDEGERERALKDHLQSVRTHINELCEKDYAALLGDKTLDFVIMCIPLEPAYQLAMESDSNLIYDLGAKNVVVTGPTTLLITIRIIAQIWRRERENRNAAEIAERAGRMYDQVELVVKAMEDSKKKLGAVSESFDTALNRLQKGRGNLVKRVEDIRRLGAKVKKQISADVVETAIGEDDCEAEAEE